MSYFAHLHTYRSPPLQGSVVIVDPISFHLSATSTLTITNAAATDILLSTTPRKQSCGPSVYSYVSSVKPCPFPHPRRRLGGQFTVSPSSSTVLAIETVVTSPLSLLSSSNRLNPSQSTQEARRKLAQQLGTGVVDDLRDGCTE